MGGCPTHFSYSPLCVVLDSASANSVLDFLHWLLSSVVSMRSCLMSGLISSPSSRLEEVSGEAEALRLGVDEAAPSTQRSPGAGSLGEAGGGVCTRLPDPFLPEMGAEMLGRRVFMVERGSAPSSLSRSLSAAAKHCPKFSLLHEATLCWMKRTMSERANGFWHTPQVRMSWWPSGPAPSASAATKRQDQLWLLSYF